MTELFTRFDGRIDRKTWWIGVVILFVALVIVSVILGFLFGDGLIGRLLVMLLGLAALWPAAALAVKRLHDRGRPALPRVALFFGPGMIVNFLNTFNIGYRPMRIPGGDVVMAPGLVVSALSLAALAAFVWALVELGFLKGDEGPNAYGPPSGEGPGQGPV